MGKRLAADEEDSCKKIPHGLDFQILPFRRFFPGRDGLAESAKCAVGASDNGRERAVGIGFHLIGAERVECGAIDCSLKSRVQLVEGTGESLSASLRVEGDLCAVVGDCRAGLGGFDF